MSGERLLIHVGVPKSATTSLQFGAFPNHPDIRYLGKPFYDEGFGYEGSVAAAEFTDSLWKQDELEFDYDLARRRFEKGIRPRLGDGRLAVLSEEGLTQASAADRVLTARRLAELCRGVECSVLVTIREQRRALFSGHQWIYSRRLTELGFEDWVRWCRSYSSYHGCFNDFPLRQYRYAGLARTYADLFGRDRVKVLPMELLAKRPTEFYAALEKFAGIRSHWSAEGKPPAARENRSPGRLGIRYQRAIKRLRALGARLEGKAAAPSEALEMEGIHGRVMRLLETVDSPMEPMSAEMADWLADYYREDNRALREFLDFDPSDYGYAG